MEGRGIAVPALHLALIHRSSGKGFSSSAQPRSSTYERTCTKSCPRILSDLPWLPHNTHRTCSIAWESYPIGPRLCVIHRAAWK
jgi:hypothetical protein